MAPFPRPFQSHFVMMMMMMVVPIAAVDDHHRFGMSTVPSTFTVSTHFTARWSAAFFTLAFNALYLAARYIVLLDGDVSLRLILSD